MTSLIFKSVTEEKRRKSQGSEKPKSETVKKADTQKRGMKRIQFNE